MPGVTPQDSRNNLAIVDDLIDNEPPEVSGHIGIQALATLADMLPHKEFVQFVNDASQAAKGGQLGSGDQAQQQPTTEPAAQPTAPSQE